MKSCEYILRFVDIDGELSGKYKTSGTSPDFLPLTVILYNSRFITFTVTYIH
jgi:hypothetical protein